MSPKKSNKSHQNVEKNKKENKSEVNNKDAGTPKKKSKKSLNKTTKTNKACSSDSEPPTTSNGHIKENNADEPITWPEKDLSKLLDRMESCLPEKDIMAYNTRAEKLDWNNIAFNDYSPEECKKTWCLIQKRIRRFRILKEVLSDARDWINKPWTDFYKGGKTKRHPDMPKRPLSTYMIFYLKKKDKILEENPGMEMTDISKKIAQMYKNISNEKREKYARLAAESKKEYERKLEEFYQKHPDIPRNLDKATNKLNSESGPKKPLTPFGLYHKEQLKKLGDAADIDKNAFKEKCKTQWKNMSDKKKILWINWALEEEVKYQEDIKNYMLQNPKFQPGNIKPVLTKEEKLIKERAAGKPTKPPNSAYSLFSRLMLQSEVIKEVDPKQRLNFIAENWRNCSEEEKKQYKERVDHLMEQYKLDFASYLESLPEDKRQEELQNNTKRKIKLTTETNSKQTNAQKRKLQSPPIDQNKKKKKNEELKESTPGKKKKNASAKIDIQEILKKEPQQPPISAQELFRKQFRDDKSANAAWKQLRSEEKKKYETEIYKLKHDYIKQFEKFLKSLPKEELNAYSEFCRLHRKEKAKSQADSSDSDEDTNDELSSESDSS